MEEKRSEKRKRHEHISVRVTKLEKEEIRGNATNCGLEASTFLRNVGLHYVPKGVLDQKAIIEMAKVNGDLGRLGGLLKLWLSEREKFVHASSEVGISNIQELFGELRSLKDELKNKIMTL